VARAGVVVATGAATVVGPVGAEPAASPMLTAQAIASAVTSVVAGKPSLRSLMIFMLPYECCRESGAVPAFAPVGCKSGARRCWHDHLDWICTK